MHDIQSIMEFIKPEQVGRYWFRGRSPTPQGRIFGGQVLAQCLLAANDTVDVPLIAHSMHAYFLRAGDPKAAIEFEVDPIRNGRSFATRRVVARQHGEAIFNTSVSYQIQEDGPQHSEPMPDIALPVADNEPQPQSNALNLLDLYQVERLRVTKRTSTPQEPVQYNWLRGKGTLTGDQRLHQAALALMSDFGLLATAFFPIGATKVEREYIAASLDHALWFHAPINVNEFLLYHCDSPWAGNARGFNRGTFWSQDGTLLASATQEALMRPKTR